MLSAEGMQAAAAAPHARLSPSALSLQLTYYGFVSDTPGPEEDPEAVWPDIDAIVGVARETLRLPPP